MSNGSGLFTNQKAVIPHSMPREVEDLRRDVGEVLKPLAAMTVEEFTNPGTSAANNLLAATTVDDAPVQILKAGLLAPGLAILAAGPRNLTFTTAGNTPADAPATALITGKGPLGEAQTETVNLAQTATIATGVKLWSDVTSIDYPAGEGTDATVAIGVGKAMYLPKKPKVRAGLAAIIKEVVAGAVVTDGVLDATNSSYTPSTGQDGLNDYAVFYEYDPLV